MKQVLHDEVILNEHTHQRTKIHTRVNEILINVNIYSWCVISMLSEHIKVICKLFFFY